MLMCRTVLLVVTVGHPVIKCNSTIIAVSCLLYRYEQMLCSPVELKL